MQVANASLRGCKEQDMNGNTSKQVPISTWPWNTHGSCESCLLFPRILDQFHYLLKVKVLVAQSCLTLCDPIDCSPPGSSVHGTLQTRIPEWVSISFSRGLSWPRDRTWVSCIAGRFFTVWDTREVPHYLLGEWKPTVLRWQHVCLILLMLLTLTSWRTSGKWELVFADSAGSLSWRLSLRIQGNFSKEPLLDVFLWIHSSRKSYFVIAILWIISIS